MKKKGNLLFFSLALIMLFSFSPAIDYEYVPILMDREEMENSIAILEAKELENPGKIYVKSDTIYVVERYKGLHVIDNKDPMSPQIKHFIRIPGIVDIAVKGHILYADNAVDLIAVDISVMSTLHVIDRKREIFPELLPPDLDYLPYSYSKENRPDNTIIVNWRKRES